MESAYIRVYLRTNSSSSSSSTAMIAQSGDGSTLPGSGMKHPDYDPLRAMLDDVGRTVKVHAG